MRGCGASGASGASGRLGAARVARGGGGAAQATRSVAPASSAHPLLACPQEVWHPRAWASLAGLLISTLHCTCTPNPTWQEVWHPRARHPQPGPLADDRPGGWCLGGQGSVGGAWGCKDVCEGQDPPYCPTHRLCAARPTPSRPCSAGAPAGQRRRAGRHRGRRLAPLCALPEDHADRAAAAGRGKGAADSGEAGGGVLLVAGGLWRGVGAREASQQPPTCATHPRLPHHPPTHPTTPHHYVRWRC